MTMSVLKLLNHFANALIIRNAYQDFQICISFDSNSGSSCIRIHDPAADSFSFNIYDSSMNFLGTIKVHNGKTALPFLPSGKYYFKLIASGGAVVKKGKFKVE
jgi:hypothetical protein